MQVVLSLVPLQSFTKQTKCITLNFKANFGHSLKGTNIFHVHVLMLLATFASK